MKQTRRAALRKLTFAALPAAVTTSCQLPLERSVRLRDPLLAGEQTLTTTETIRKGHPTSVADQVDSGPTATLSFSQRKARARAEFQQQFLASGAALRFHPHPAHGRPWTDALGQSYDRFKGDQRVSYAVQNLRTGRYLAEQNADEQMFGGSMPKPAVAATLLERRKGALTQAEFMHIVQVCDRSINASWRALLARFNHADEQAFEQKYALPDVGIRRNFQSPRFYSEFFRRAVNYQFDYGNELLLEAMRRAQFGRGRWYLPSEITYVGGKTGTYNEWKHEGLFLYFGSTPYSIVVYTKGHFGRGDSYWKMGALFGGLFREQHRVEPSTSATIWNLAR